MFAYPNPGAMVWVFFREGNPLYPVYFAASYSASEWASAYSTSSDSPLKSNANPAEVTIESSIFKTSSALTIASKKRINLFDPLDNESVASISHEHGSGLTMSNNCDFYRSSSNRRDEVDNDRHIVTRGYKEEWVEGDSSTNVRGDVFIKVGNISQEAIDAMTKLSDMSYELNQKLKEKPSPSASSSSSNPSPAETPLPESFQQAIDQQRASFWEQKSQILPTGILPALAPDPRQQQNRTTGNEPGPTVQGASAYQASLDASKPQLKGATPTTPGVGKLNFYNRPSS
jgi:hypothetical protein